MAKTKKTSNDSPPDTDQSTLTDTRDALAAMVDVARDTQDQVEAHEVYVASRFDYFSARIDGFEHLLLQTLAAVSSGNPRPHNTLFGQDGPGATDDPPTSDDDESQDWVTSDGDESQDRVTSDDDAPNNDASDEKGVGGALEANAKGDEEAKQPKAEDEKEQGGAGDGIQQDTEDSAQSDVGEPADGHESSPDIQHGTGTWAPGYIKQRVNDENTIRGPRDPEDILREARKASRDEQANRDAAKQAAEEAAAAQAEVNGNHLSQKPKTGKKHTKKLLSTVEEDVEESDDHARGTKGSDQAPTPAVPDAPTPRPLNDKKRKNKPNDAAGAQDEENGEQHSPSKKQKKAPKQQSEEPKEELKDQTTEKQKSKVNTVVRKH